SECMAGFVGIRTRIRFSGCLSRGTPLRYIFFGLRSDVTAAQYLYEMVERAFDTETAVFRRSDLYEEMKGDRRSATNSFQIGLSRGISAKLGAMRLARDETIRSASGRDLVPVKSAMIEEEILPIRLLPTTPTCSAELRKMASLGPIFRFCGWQPDRQGRNVQAWAPSKSKVPRYGQTRHS
ncbi:DUF7168 domain-containing protein, partial [Acidiphilium sp.]|uniref:DUF7168 domain-containing protein n=1 Tax=Acidiphilium sp. TaxID=527 RepID=UPI003D009B5E